ncbi:MAG TPA: hypothetical protein VGK92_09875, partial [Gaiellales bacterium]
MTKLRAPVLALSVAAVSFSVLAASATGATAHKQAVSGKLSMVGIWTGPEQKNFQLVLDAFHAK